MKTNHQAITDYIELGNRFLLGDGVEKNIDRACELYKKAAELGNLSAMKQVGGMNFYSLVSNASLEEATNWYCRAADSGDTESLYMAGKCCLLTNGKDLWDKGIDFLKRSKDSRAIALLKYACNPIKKRREPKTYKIAELYNMLRRDEINTKYVYRGETKSHPYPLRPSAFRCCDYSKFPMCGSFSGIRNWGNCYYLEHGNLKQTDKKWKSHAVKRIMSMYLNNALGYPLSQALLQQAGYSSEGLDVTYNIKIALFFALNYYNETDGKYYRKESKEPSVIYRWKVPGEAFTLHDNYYCKAHFIPTLNIFQQFNMCESKRESVESLERYLAEIHWGSLDFDLPTHRPYELLKIPKESMKHGRIAVQEAALLIPDVIPGRQMQLRHEEWGYPIGKKSDLDTNLVHDLADPSICDTFFIDCSDVLTSDLDMLAGLPFSDQIYNGKVEDITHVLTNNIMEQAYRELLMTGLQPREIFPAMPGYGLSYMEAMSQIQEWNRDREDSIYFFK